MASLAMSAKSALSRLTPRRTTSSWASASAIQASSWGKCPWARSGTASSLTRSGRLRVDGAVDAVVAAADDSGGATPAACSCSSRHLAIASSSALAGLTAAGSTGLLGSGSAPKSVGSAPMRRGVMPIDCRHASNVPAACRKSWYASFNSFSSISFGRAFSNKSTLSRACCIMRRPPASSTCAYSCEALAVYSSEFESTSCHVQKRTQYEMLRVLDAGSAPEGAWSSSISG